MKTHFDIVIIGAGPAGMAAAIKADKYQCSVLVLDENDDPGGQIYCSVEKVPEGNFALLGEDYLYGKNLVRSFRNANIEYQTEAVVWQVGTDLKLCYSHKGRSYQVQAKKIIIATGAMERPTPIPGWTLPGVMGAAAVDRLVKESDLLPSGNIVIAGNGPLFLLVASRLIEMGANVEAILDTGKQNALFRALKYLPKALPAWKNLQKGLGLKSKIRKSSVPVFNGVMKLEAKGDERVESVSFSHSGKVSELQVDTLLLHDGVIPNTQITRQLDCEHEWIELQRYWKPQLDAWGNTSVKGIYVAGDSGGVYGAKAAENLGHLVALGVLADLKKISAEERDSGARAYRNNQTKELSIRPFLEHLFVPQIHIPEPDNTVVCRCEEATAGEIKDAVKYGATGSRQVKFHTRCGMGMCQGRMCNPTSAEIIAKQRKLPMEAIGYAKIRPPIKPIILNEIAEMDLID